MRTGLIAAAVLGVLCLGGQASAQTAEEKLRREHEKLEGTWYVVRAEAEGTPIPPQEYRALRLTFKNGQFTARRGKDDSDEGTYTIDPTRRPKTMDVTPRRGRPQLAVYELTGNTLKICSDTSGKERPEGFETRDQPGYTLMVL
jgi:uncharacterized protein (TIGR03067 family)